MKRRQKPGRKPGDNPFISLAAAKAFLKKTRSKSVRLLPPLAAAPTVTTEYEILMDAADIASRLYIHATMQDRFLEILKTADSEPGDAEDWEQGINRNVRRLLKQLVYIKTFFSCLEVDIWPTKAPPSPPLTKELTALIQGLDNLHEELNLSWMRLLKTGIRPLANANPTVSENPKKAFAATVALRCSAAGIQAPNGRELAALAVLKGLEEPIAITENHLRRGLSERELAVGYADRWNKIAARLNAPELTDKEPQ